MVYRRGFVAVVAVMLVIVGCGPKKPPETRVVDEVVSLKTEVRQAREIEPSSRVLGSANALEVKAIRTTTTADALNVQVEVLNNRGRRDILYYRLRWLDETGMQVGQYDTWLTESFEGFQKSVLSFRAPDPRVTDFRFEIKPKY